MFCAADATFVFDQIISSNSPESCWAYLTKLERRGDPHTDTGLLNKLKDFYSKVFSRLPIRQYRKNARYARMLVRYAELKGSVCSNRYTVLKIWSVACFQLGYRNNPVDKLVFFISLLQH